MNGSGRYPANATLADVRRDLNMKPGDKGTIPLKSALAVTVPGAAAGWVDTVERFGSGKLSLEQILMPAIELAEEGFPVSEISSQGVSCVDIHDLIPLWKNYTNSRNSVASQRAIDQGSIP